MRGPELAEMNAFVTVAERRSFAKAAVQLGISRSRLSETIRELEDRLGVRLLNRTTRSVAPTTAGERLLAQIRPLLDDFSVALIDQRIPRQASRAVAPHSAAASG
jgi:DNA-binding transcriptional LysR family regulator